MGHIKVLLKLERRFRGFQPVVVWLETVLQHVLGQRSLIGIILVNYSVFIYRFYWVTCTAPVIIGNWRRSKCFY